MARMHHSERYTHTECTGPAVLPPGTSRCCPAAAPGPFRLASAGVYFQGGSIVTNGDADEKPSLLENRLSPPAPSRVESESRPSSVLKRSFMLKPARTSRPDPPVPGVTYASREVARMSRVSLRQLQWWDEKHVVSPRHQGHRRMYTAEEVLEVTLISELRRKGFSLQKLRRVLRFLQKGMDRRLSEVLAGNSDLHLLTDGKSIFLEDRQERVIDILKNARQPMFLVCVSDHAKRLGPGAKKPVRPATLPAVRKARAG